MEHQWTFTVNFQPFLSWGGYLNFSAWFMKNLYLEQKNRKLENKWHFVGNGNSVNFPVIQIQKINFQRCYANAGH